MESHGMSEKMESGNSQLTKKDMKITISTFKYQTFSEQEALPLSQTLSRALL